MESLQISDLVRAFTNGCTQPGAYERLYADIEPRRCRWARNAKCGDMSRRGGIILCKEHAWVGYPLLPYSWQG
jgi:hypothetical protein